MVSGLLSKKQYAPSAAIRFIRKLLTDLCLECTRFPLSLSKWLMHSMIYLFLSIILSHNGICLFFMLFQIPVTRCTPSAKSALNKLGETEYHTKWGDLTANQIIKRLQKQGLTKHNRDA